MRSVETQFRRRSDLVDVLAAGAGRQFELELVTQDTQILRGLGANKPTKTIVRYRRRELAPAEPELAAAAGG